MNYKKLFYGYLIFNIISGAVVGFIRATEQAKVKKRISSPRKFQTQEMQDIVNHYNKEKVA